jgi:hypothetical protein
VCVSRSDLAPIEPYLRRLPVRGAAERCKFLSQPVNVVSDPIGFHKEPEEDDVES